MADRNAIIGRLERVKNLLLNESPLDAKLLETLDHHLDNVLNPPQSSSIKTDSGNVIRIWSDGACQGNPGPGGWAAIVARDDEIEEISGGAPKTTNNIMEMTAALEGIKRTPRGSRIILTTDSQYLVKGITQWLKGWKKKGWKKANGSSVLNQELWMELDREVAKRRIEWVWVRGHSGHPQNERCDKLAKKAISLQ